MTLREMWQRMTSGRSLEAELARQGADIDRLRAENRALLNSILGIAGIPPINVTEPTDSLAPAAQPRSIGTALDAPCETSGHIFSCADRAAAPSASVGAGLKPAPTGPMAGDARIVSPLRRRSWHQINRMLELESARKPVSGES